jgi:hypothetical protein
MSSNKALGVRFVCERGERKEICAFIVRHALPDWTPVELVHGVRVDTIFTLPHWREAPKKWRDCYRRFYNHYYCYWGETPRQLASIARHVLMERNDGTQISLL